MTIIFFCEKLYFGCDYFNEKVAEEASHTPID